MKTVEIDLHGKRQTHEVSRKILTETLDIPFRDLRPIFSISQVATIFARGRGIVMNLGVIKMLITNDRVWVGNTDDDEVTKIITPGLVKAIKTDKDQVDFELRVMEFALNHKLGKMKRTLEELEKSIERMLRKVTAQYDDQSLERLLLLKKKLTRFETIVQENEGAALEVLDDDEELADLCVTQKVKKKKKIDFEEIESILESFTEQLERLRYRVVHLKENIDDTQEIVALKLQNRRNHIIRYDLMATLITALFSLLAVVTGLYGMNIRNNLEQNNEAFWTIAISFVVTIVLFLVVVRWYLKRRKVL